MLPPTERVRTIVSFASMSVSFMIVATLIVAPVLPAGIVIFPSVKLWSNGLLAVPETV